MDDFGCHDDDDVIFSWLIPDEEDWIDGGRGGEVNGNSHGSVGNTLVSKLEPVCPAMCSTQDALERRKELNKVIEATPPHGGRNGHTSQEETHESTRPAMFPGVMVDTSYRHTTVSFGEKVKVVGRVIDGLKDDLNVQQTGFVVWPAAMILSQHLVSHRELVRAGRVLEVGAGVGLPGLVAAALSEDPSGVVMTDYVEDAVDLMDMNIAETFGEDNNRPQAAIMDWDDDPSVLQEHHGTFDVIIGSDVVYWPVLIEPLIRTVKALLSNKPTSWFLMLYSRRNPKADKLLFRTALKYRLDSRELSLEQNAVYHAVLNHPVYREDTDMFHLYEFRHSNEP
ncbi:protein N-terminal and lysine N-methyltransferase EFM7-like isoform X2 [Branchiostoma floridae]|nr:protein N-terminal and lysine N-methyltransferase EFM7-like isoform X2 [Branchiostoma floridae]